MKKFFSEFKAFIARGNVVDMAVAVIIGGAFGKIVTSLVNDILMPVIGLIAGGTNVAELKFVFREAEIVDDVIVTPEAAIAYGAFIQSVIDFLIIALCMFLFLKVVLLAKDTFNKKEEAAAVEEAPAPEEKKETSEEILSEIRELLRENSKK